MKIKHPMGLPPARQLNKRKLEAFDEMLAALKAVEEDLSISSETWEDDREMGPASKDGPGRDPDTLDVCSETQELIRAAIAKAEGR